MTDAEVKQEAERRYEGLRNQGAEMVRNDPQFDGARDTVALLINSQGFLCAEVVDVRQHRPGQNIFEVTCVERRNGEGRVEYLVNTDAGRASRL